MHFGSTIWTALGIGLLIFIHEFGHFVAARMAGVHVEVFSLGFGPRLCGFGWRGTDFRLSLVPFGGFVMVAGQDPTDRRYPPRQSLYAKSIGQRALFWSGGVLMNALFALAVFPLVFHAGVDFQAPVVGKVDAGSPAWVAGIEAGDRIRAVQGKAMYSFENLAVEIALHGGRPIALEIERVGGVVRTVVATAEFDSAAGLFVLGIRPAYVDEFPPIEVTADGPAAVAGLRSGDLLRTVNGVAPRGSSLEDALRALVPMEEQPLRVEVERNGEPIVAALQPVMEPDGKTPPSIGVRPLPRRVNGVRAGVAFLDRLGLQRDDRLLAVDDTPFLTGDLAAHATAQAATARPVLRIHVQRGHRVLCLEQPATAADRAFLATHVAIGHDLESLWLEAIPGRPAAAAGLRTGDVVETINGIAVRRWDDLKDTVERSGEKPMRFQLRRLAATNDPFPCPATAAELPRGELIELTIQPQSHRNYQVGLVPVLREHREEVRAQSFGEALRLGTVCSLDLVKQLYVTLKRLITGDIGAKNLSGIIGISKVSYQAAQRGPSWFLYFLALLSVNLAFVNLLPVPVLDGGHLLFLLIERVKGSPVSTRVLGYSQVVGLVFVLLLVVFVTYNDILRLF